MVGANTLRRQAAAGHAEWLVLFVHGLGSNGADLMNFADYWARSMPDIAFAAPSAPTPCPEAEGGFQWMPKLPPGHPRMMQEVETAAPVLEKMIDEELVHLGLGPDRLVLVGFSQGTVLSLHVGPRRAVAPAAILGYAGGMVARGRLADEVRSRPPAMLINGDADPMVPADAQAMAVAALQESGIVAAGQIMPGLDHSVNAEALILGGRFILSACKYRKEHPL